MAKIYKVLVLMLVLGSTLVYAQRYTISGVVTSASTGEKLLGTNVYLKGTTLGAATDIDGKYSITADKGEYTLTCSYIGYETKQVEINLNKDLTVDFSLKDYQFSLSVEVISNRAKERETPVAFTNIDKRDIEKRLGSRDIPLVLNTTPSVYATDNGGGAGDSRINIRGFNQRNVAIMINGVPINDMENGWVYWSNWDGLGDATSSIQLQRGLSAVNLATPSVGGTMNVITDPTKVNPGVFYKNEMGSGTFAKQTLFAHTGLIDNKFALSLGGVRKTGAGVVDKTWTDAWAYYFGASYQINGNNRIELYGMGAPQRHGQRSYKLNAATFDHEYAKELGYTDKMLNDPKLAEQSLNYNANWNSVNPNYTDYQYWDGSKAERFSQTSLMERENYYHKPIVNLNWYSQLSSKLSLYTTAYYSGGVGGGSSPGSGLKYDRTLQQQVIDWDATIASNAANIDTLKDGRIVKLSKAVHRNSVNKQWTIGLISKAFYKINPALNLSFGVDWRTATVEHYREVRDLLGGDFLLSKDSEFDITEAQQLKGLGDRIAYDFTNTINWYGGYAQAEYTRNRWSLYAMGGLSMIKYSNENHFKKGPNGGFSTIESDNLIGYQAKGGASYRLTELIDLYANAGYINRAPILDQVMDDQNSILVTNPDNEKIMSVEVGANAYLLKRMLSLKGNFYYTSWKDRGVTRGVINPDGTDGLVRISGVNSLHTGVEFELAFQPIKYARLDAAASFGDWKYTDDVAGNYTTTSGGAASIVNYNFYLSDVKVGDAPQTQIAAALSVMPFEGLTLQADMQYNAKYFADFDPFGRSQAYFKDEQSWEIPSYTLYNFHFSYDVPVSIAGLDVTLFGHVFNLLDEVFVQDAVDNSRYNGYYKDNPDRNGDTKKNNLDGMHTADDAEVFLGLPRTFNLGFSVRL
ncbi:MAG: TonB-dependent receptor [Ignavibacteria bacterium CG2_30_36_16]|nr:TonB-dependent receptor [Ignavibacteria bacterium]OIP58355.1 MAG: TonB-dependent receptor [Ignavibacteria bacterium CG2_30_36_16]PJB01304.1 MAG: TonB-dependent receptor [Ignavibacteria bacterium CG_4_9_14_3_um_filter_36_18]